MKWALIMLFAACATHDVLRSEPVVLQGVCEGQGVGVFGMRGDDSCGAQVVSLGDGCYVALKPGEQRPRPRQQLADGAQWNPHLFECAANGPGHHVACVEDPIGPRVQPLDVDAAVIVTRTVEMDGDTAMLPTTARCIDHLEAWETLHAPPLGPALVEMRDSKGHRVTSRVAETAVQLRHAVGPSVAATVCNDNGALVAELRARVPEGLSHELVAMVTHIYVEHDLAADCREQTFQLRLVD